MYFGLESHCDTFPQFDTLSLQLFYFVTTFAVGFFSLANHVTTHEDEKSNWFGVGVLKSLLKAVLQG